MPKPILTVATALLAACASGGMHGAAPGSAKGGWLYAWASSADTSHRGAFLAQFDLREGSPSAGKIVRVIPAGEGSYSTHHAEHSLPSDGLYFADDFGLGRSYIFDLNDPANPRLRTSFTTAGPFGWPHSYVRLPSGSRLVTYQFQKTKFNLPPGGLAEVGTDGKIIRWANATTPGVDDKDITPYSLEILPAMDRVVSTSTSMVEDTGVGIQIWRLSDLALLHTLRIPAGNPHGMHAADTVPHHLFPGEPRLLHDGKTVMLATFTCGLYVVTGIDTSSPTVTPVYTFPGQNCAVPVTTGKYWIQTVPATHSVVVLDVSNPMTPREVSTLDLGKDASPHWLAMDGTGTRLVVNNGSRSDSQLYLIRFNPRTGALSREPGIGRLDLSGVNVPGLGVVTGIPHASVFSR
jgi:hypothetical protein